MGQSLIILSGLPGSGKSYFARELADGEDMIIVESDALRRLLFPKPVYTKEESAFLFRTCHAFIEDQLRRGRSVISDSTNLQERNRIHLYDIAGRTRSKLIIVNVVATMERIEERLKARAEGTGTSPGNSEAGLDVYHKMARNVDEITRPHFVVDSTYLIGPVVAGVLLEMGLDDA